MSSIFLSQQISEQYFSTYLFSKAIETVTDVVDEDRPRQRHTLRAMENHPWPCMTI
jgi:phytoene/squalene synthetase